MHWIPVALLGSQEDGFIITVFVSSFPRNSGLHQVSLVLLPLLQVQAEQSHVPFHSPRLKQFLCLPWYISL